VFQETGVVGVVAERGAICRTAKFVPLEINKGLSPDLLRNSPC